MSSEFESLADKKKFFQNFIESNDSDEDSIYRTKIKQTIEEGKFRLIVNINDIRRYGDVGAAVANLIVRNPREWVIGLQEAAMDIATEMNDPTVQKLLKTNEIQVGFEGSVGHNAVSPRGLLSNLLNNLVDVEGIVTKCSSIKPKMVRSVQYCPETSVYRSTLQHDSTSLRVGVDVNGDGKFVKESSGAIAKADDMGHPIELDPGYSNYKDCQSIILQEMPERAKVGQLPRSVKVIFEHDLVDRVKPGDRIKVTGIYMALSPSINSNSISSDFDSVILCNNVSIIGKEVGSVKLSGDDVRNIKQVSSVNQDSILEIMSRSLCPSIFGHAFVKKALILQLLGGDERNLENGTHLRGDINVMLVGDPSTAKSRLLRAIIDIAPLAISTTGRGSSGVGLTAAVTIEPESGEKRLEAGAMVLADRGIVCIDEFDKMGENDRVAIHEVMEQQTVTIAKAGIHASLNARCSVLAAANPVYGQYDKTRRPQDNIGLPDSLLSRFDLLFVILDQLDPMLDRELSEHILKAHQYRRPGTIMEPESLITTSSLNLDDDEDDENNVNNETPVWVRGGRALKDASSSSASSSSSNDMLTKSFLRKYIHFAKNRVKPVLSDEAMEAISSAYTNMRAKQSKKNLPVTARSLETIIRLSTANAKARLSKSVDTIDVTVATDLINFVLFHDIGGSSSSADGEPVTVGRKRNHMEASNENSNTINVRHDDDGVDALGPDEFTSFSDEFASSAKGISVDRQSSSYKTIVLLIKNKMDALFDSCTISELYALYCASMPPTASVDARFVQQQFFLAIVFELENDNKIMVTIDDNRIDILS